MLCTAYEIRDRTGKSRGRVLRIAQARRIVKLYNAQLRRLGVPETDSDYLAIHVVMFDREGK